MDAIKTPDTTDVETDADLESATFAEQVHFCTPEEWWELVERQTREHFNMSADEFVRALRAGELGDPDQNREVMSIAMMLPIDW